MNILLIGNGGREHAIAWKLKQSPLCEQLYVAPGNAGTADIATNVPIPAENFIALGKFCEEKKIGLVVVGPEVPLVNGIRDHFTSDPSLKNILFVGPDKIGAQLEGSKDFSKQFMIRHGIPTAKAKTFDVTQSEEAISYLSHCKTPIVLKADGLAAGKGVIITSDIPEAQQVIREMLIEKKFGDASARVLVEEFLEGIELSVFVLSDGTDYVILPEAKDYKRIGDGDTGPNTGGMGAVSPVVFAGPSFMKKVEEQVIIPTINGLRQEGIDYKGFIFIGLMNVGGDPYVIEYNARMGDPETQAVMMRIQNDLVELLAAAAAGNLKGHRVQSDPDFAITVSLVSGGYPGLYEKGKEIHGLENKDTMIFHAGTKNSNGKILTDGGRVLSVTARGKTLEEARKNAYACISGIAWDGLSFRKDIGVDLMNFE